MSSTTILNINVVKLKLHFIIWGYSKEIFRPGFKYQSPVLSRLCNLIGFGCGLNQPLEKMSKCVFFCNTRLTLGGLIFPDELHHRQGSNFESRVTVQPHPLHIESIETPCMYSQITL